MEIQKEVKEASYRSMNFYTKLSKVDTDKKIIGSVKTTENVNFVKS